MSAPAPRQDPLAIRPAPPLLRQAQRRRRVTPFRVVMAVAVLGSLALIAFGLVERTASQIPILVAGLTVLGLTFAAMAVACVVTVVRAGRDGRTALAFWSALAGGVAVVAAAGCLASAVVLAMVWGSAAAV